MLGRGLCPAARSSMFEDIADLIDAATAQIRHASAVTCKVTNLDKLTLRDVWLAMLRYEQSSFCSWRRQSK